MNSYKKTPWGEADVVCPFFLTQDRKTASICCEGGIEGTKTVTRFEGLKARDSYMGHFCCSFNNFPKCAHYQFVNQKYE